MVNVMGKIDGGVVDQRCWVDEWHVVGWNLVGPWDWLGNDVSGWDAAVLGDWCWQHGVWEGSSLGDGDDGEKCDEELQEKYFLVHSTLITGSLAFKSMPSHFASWLRTFLNSLSFWCGLGFVSAEANNWKTQIALIQISSPTPDFIQLPSECGEYVSSSNSRLKWGEISFDNRFMFSVQHPRVSQRPPTRWHTFPRLCSDRVNNSIHKECYNC